MGLRRARTNCADHQVCRNGLTLCREEKRGRKKGSRIIPIGQVRVGNRGSLDREWEGTGRGNRLFLCHKSAELEGDSEGVWSGLISQGEK